MGMVAKPKLARWSARSTCCSHCARRGSSSIERSLEDTLVLYSGQRSDQMFHEVPMENSMKSAFRDRSTDASKPTSKYSAPTELLLPESSDVFRKNMPVSSA